MQFKETRGQVVKQTAQVQKDVGSSTAPDHFNYTKVDKEAEFIYILIILTCS